MTRTADLRVSSSLIGEFPRCISPVWQLTDIAVMNKAVAPGEFAGKLWESAHLDEFCGNLCGKETYRPGSVDSLPDLLAELRREPKRPGWYFTLLVSLPFAQKEIRSL